MKIKLFMIFLMISFIIIAASNSPSHRNSPPGCDGRGCHAQQGGMIELQPLDNLQIQVNVRGVKTGKLVGGELVNQQNRIVDFVNETRQNPFILTAPAFGEYTINVGFKHPAMKWTSRQIWLRPQTINIPTPSRIRSQLALYDNHPNPFNHETLIRFSLPKTMHIEMFIFDENGKFIKQLTNGWYPAGVHAIRWNGRNQDGLPQPPGIYLCEIKSEDRRVVQRMVLAK
jgi:hypothetical protein